VLGFFLYWERRFLTGSGSSAAKRVPCLKKAVFADESCMAARPEPMRTSALPAKSFTACPALGVPVFNRPWTENDQSDHLPHAMWCLEFVSSHKGLIALRAKERRAQGYHWLRSIVRHHSLKYVAQRQTPDLSKRDRQGLQYFLRRLFFPCSWWFLTPLPQSPPPGFS